MGVYCFRWTGGPWIKVGHYKGRNPWSRIAHRGWFSVIVPDPALHHHKMDRFEVLFWNPEYTRKDERGIHKAFADAAFGEWFPDYMIPEILAALGGDTANCKDNPECDMNAAASKRRRL
nr:hypothetical protein TetV2_00488 [Oceanusvirus sp.]